MIEIPVNKIIANKYQPRNYFDDEKLMELASSIRENGLLQPITVRPKGKKFEIIAGERRFRAVGLLGKTSINAIIIEKDDSESAKLALIENLQREDLSSIEIAQSYSEIMELTNISQSDLAIQLGVSQSGIANKLRLLKLDTKVKKLIQSKQLGERHARCLLDLDVRTQRRLAKRCVKEQWTVVQLEKVVNKKPKEKTEKKVFKGYSNDMRIAINTMQKGINDTVKMVGSIGVKINQEIKELEDEYQIVIKIKK